MAVHSLEAGNLLFTDASKFYSSYISSAQRLPNGNTLITEGSDGHLLEVTPDHEIVWEFVNPYFKNFAGTFKSNMIYRAYRVPYEWIPQLEKPVETSIEPIDITKFRVPGLLLARVQGLLQPLTGSILQKEFLSQVQEMKKMMKNASTSVLLL